jgi:hypothetical protein
LRARGDLLPKHPFGTPLTSTEVVLSEVLEALRAKGASWKGRMQLLAATLASGKTPSGAETYLERMALDRPRLSRGEVVSTAASVGAAGARSP